jgi:phenylpropionate dioxygenase-like ring-hydroxylating dioxygenase large terminal subunit
MEHTRIVDLVRRACVEARKPEPSMLEDCGEIPLRHYTDPERLKAERATLFRRLPLPIAHASEVGARRMTVRELDGVSLVLTRGADGDLRAFKNACRHRGVRLVREDCPAKAFVCPYHGWTYGSDGRLLHVPHEAAFASCNLERRDLVPVKAEERHGLVWVALDPGAPDVASHLGEIDEEVGAFGFARHAVGHRVVREQRGNWKFLMEAFLDGYHVRTLHRDTIYPYFLDARNHAEPAGPHVRSAVARRSAKEVALDATFASQSLRDLATLAYVIFPATTLIAHPDWTSLVTVQPIATDRFMWSHTQLICEEPTTDAARAHFDRSFRLIEQGVFEGEDLLMCSEAQAGLETGANEAITFGRLESPALWFHRAVAERLG